MKTMFRFLLLILVTLPLASCADKKDTARCSVQLDEQKYSTVAENSGCTNYQRASGYLGQAGVSFGNFLKTGAMDNLTKTLGISKLSLATDYTTGNRGYVTKALCLIGANSIVKSSRCDGSSSNRATDELEISMFANIADLIYLNYGVLDTDLNGTLSETETKAFTSLSTTGVDSSGGGTDLSSSNRFEVVGGGTSYISNSDLSKCVTYTDNFTDNASSGSNCVAKAISDGVTITKIRPIIKLDNMTDITGGSSLTSRIAMVSELTTLSNALEADFTALGLSSTNNLRKSLSAGLSKLDNGAKSTKNNGTCVKVAVFDVMYLLVQDPADNSTTSSGLKSKNLISLSDLENSVDSNLTYPNVSGYTITDARLIYATDSPATTYTDSFEKAESSLYTAMKNTRSLGTEASVKGDGKVSFREIICIDEN
ncbi:MAG: hypothetical protein MK481_09535 [SAR324 cluster bacterium]|nr:hypothetical protein [SAR324 cluster bacterium]